MKTSFKLQAQTICNAIHGMLFLKRIINKNKLSNEPYSCRFQRDTWIGRWPEGRREERKSK